jgi:LysR family cyn operon transcriptional activator
MELRHLRYFLALAESLNFTRAAERVHVTQSTLSHQIRQLEDEVGQPLFERAGRRVLMTEAGDAFLAYAQRALKEIDQGLGELKRGRHAVTGVVRIGTTHTFNLGFIPACVAVFLARHPTVRVVVEELEADTIISRLESGGLDLGVSYRPSAPGDLRFEPLFNEELLLAVRATHPLARRKRIRMIELHREPLVLLPARFSTRRLLDECFAAAGAEPDIVAEMNSVASMIGLVARANVGAIVAPNAVARDSALRMIPLESPTPVRTPGLLFKADHPLDRAGKAFAALVRKQAMGGANGRAMDPPAR